VTSVAQPSPGRCNRNGEQLAAALVAVACGYAAMWLVHVVALVVGDTGIGWVGACELVVFGFVLGMGYKGATDRFSCPRRRRPDSRRGLTGDDYWPGSPPGRN
jgi:hypothetical protein